MEDAGTMKVSPFKRTYSRVGSIITLGCVKIKILTLPYAGQAYLHVQPLLSEVANIQNLVIKVEASQ